MEHFFIISAALVALSGLVLFSLGGGRPALVVLGLGIATIFIVAANEL